MLGLQLDCHGNHKCRFEPENMQRISFVFPRHLSQTQKHREENSVTAAGMILDCAQSCLVFHKSMNSIA